MTQFYREYSSLAECGPRAMAQLDPGFEDTEKRPLSVAQSSPDQIVQMLVAQISWAHNMLLIQQVKDMSIRLWCMQQTIEQVGSGISKLEASYQNEQVQEEQ